MIEDLRFVWRAYSRRPAAAAAMIAVLAIGLGAATAAYSVADYVLLRPLPYGAADRLAALWENDPAQAIAREATSAPNFVDWKTMNSTFSDLGAYTDWLPISIGAAADEQLIGAQVTANFFRVLQVVPVAGRSFDEQDARPGAAPVALIGYADWIAKFGGAPVKNLWLRLGAQNYSVVGVLPPSFRQPGPTAHGRPVRIWKALTIRANPGARRWDSLNVIGRLKPAATFDQARSDFRVISAHLAAQYPEADGAFKIAVTPLREALAAPVRRPLLMLLAAVVALLAITWMNLANILAARSLERETEFAIREALGASKWRRFRLLLLESLSIAAVSSAAAAIVAVFTLRAFALQASRWAPGIENSRIDARVLAVCLLASLLAAPLFAALSMLMVRGNTTGALRGRGTSSSRGVSRLRASLITAEIVLTVVLQTAGVALLRDFLRLQRTSVGYETQNIVTAQIQLPPLAKPNDPRDARSGLFLRDLVANVERLPGVRMAAAIDTPPFVNRGADLEFVVDGAPQPAPGKIQSAEMHLVSPGYFRLSRMILLQGRFFSSEDGLNAPMRVIVSHSCVTKYFEGLAPVGRRVALKVPTGLGPWRTVVGEVADVSYREMKAQRTCQIYMPHEQEAWPAMALVVKTDVAPASLAPSLYKVLRRMDPTRPLYNIRTDEDLRGEALASRRFSMSLVHVVGSVSLLVALAGVYGIVSFSVARRTREVGVRMSVGARPGEIVLMFLRGSAIMAVIALSGALVLNFAAAAAIRRVIEDLNAFDALSCSIVCTAVFACVMLASYIPARRASATDPAEALRHE